MRDYLFTPPETLWQRLQPQVPAGGVDMVHEAYRLAKDAHAGQTRHEGTPYIVHPLRVALLLAGRPDLDADARILAAALLHDVVEDTGITVNELAIRFGDEVAGWVRALTKPPKEARPQDWEERYYAALSTAPRPARLIKLADRLDNLAGLSLRPEAKQAAYHRETRAYLLPLAATTDAAWEAELRRALG